MTKDVPLCTCNYYLFSHLKNSLGTSFYRQFQAVIEHFEEKLWNCKSIFIDCCNCIEVTKDCIKIVIFDQGWFWRVTYILALSEEVISWEETEICNRKSGKHAPFDLTNELARWWSWSSDGSNPIFERLALSTNIVCVCVWWERERKMEEENAHQLCA